jgi:hypothetical protein
MKRLVAVGLLLACGACAHSGASSRPVPIESRPTPAQPGATPTPSAPHAATPAALRARIEADTLAARSALRRCEGRQLLAEQESTVEGANLLLGQTRAALASGDLGHAESLARQARQLTRSLDCP